MTARLPAALDKLGLNKPETEVLRKALQAGPTTEPVVNTEEYTIAGVIRAPTDEEQKGPRASPLSVRRRRDPSLSDRSRIFTSENRYEEQGVSQAFC